MLAQQPGPLRRLSQIQHRKSEVLAVARADPHRVELEFGERGFDVHRREVAGLGEIDAVVAYSTVLLHGDNGQGAVNAPEIVLVARDQRNPESDGHRGDQYVEPARLRVSANSTNIRA